MPKSASQRTTESVARRKERGEAQITVRVWVVAEHRDAAQAAVRDAAKHAAEPFRAR